MTDNAMFATPSINCFFEVITYMISRLFMKQSYL